MVLPCLGFGVVFPPCYQKMLTGRMKYSTSSLLLMVMMQLRFLAKSILIVSAESALIQSFK